MKSNVIYLPILAFSLFAISCKESKKETPQTTVASDTVTSDDATEEAPILLGLQDVATLEKEPYKAWWDENTDFHDVDVAAIPAIASGLKDIDITVFMGTWCEDSQMQTPAFYKILKAAKYTKSPQLITVSEDKDTPEKLEEGLNITNVPTFIFKKDGKEIGRIVEYPIESLEADMLKILSGEDYKHAYEE